MANLIKMDMRRMFRSPMFLITVSVVAVFNILLTVGLAVLVKLFGAGQEVAPTVFSDVLATLMGALLLVLGLFHFVYLLLSLRSIDVRGWYFIMPLLVAIVGGVVLFMPSVRSNVNEVVLVTGISLLLFNITSLQEYFAERRTIKAQLAALKAQQDAAATAVVTDEPEKPAAATEEDTEA